jgi:transaldolase
MTRVADLKVKIFADGADLQGIVAMSKMPYIKGFTTDPTLMRNAGADHCSAGHASAEARPELISHSVRTTHGADRFRLACL